MTFMLSKLNYLSVLLKNFFVQYWKSIIQEFYSRDCMKSKFSINTIVFILLKFICLSLQIIIDFSVFFSLRFLLHHTKLTEFFYQGRKAFLKHLFFLALWLIIALNKRCLFLLSHDIPKFDFGIIVIIYWFFDGDERARNK